MSLIRCECNGKKCRAAVGVADHTLVIWTRDGKPSRMSLSPKIALAIIQALGPIAVKTMMGLRLSCVNCDKEVCQICPSCGRVTCVKHRCLLHAVSKKTVPSKRRGVASRRRGGPQVTNPIRCYLGDSGVPVTLLVRDGVLFVEGHQGLYESHIRTLFSVALTSKAAGELIDALMPLTVRLYPSKAPVLQIPMKDIPVGKWKKEPKKGRNRR